MDYGAGWRVLLCVFLGRCVGVCAVIRGGGEMISGGGLGVERRMKLRVFIFTFPSLLLIETILGANGKGAWRNVGR